MKYNGNQKTSLQSTENNDSDFSFAAGFLFAHFDETSQKIRRQGNESGFQSRAPQTSKNSAILESDPSPVEPSVK